MGRPLFVDRDEAGHALADRLARLDLPPPVRVLALPRGGVPLGVAVARKLGVTLDLALVRKIGAPGQDELAVAAVVDQGEPLMWVDEALAQATGADANYLARRRGEAWQEILRRRALYLGGRAPAPVDGATVIVVDDGMATGTTMRTVVKALRQRHPAQIVVAVPVAPRHSVAELAAEADRVVCLAEPADFHAVGACYGAFPQLTDDEVLQAMRPQKRAG